MAPSTSIANALLSYAAHRMDVASMDAIKRECVEFYSSEEILNARDALWGITDDNVKTILPRMIRRHSMDQRKGCEQTIMDILDALLKLDAEEKMPLFLVDYTQLARIPGVRLREAGKDALCERVARLEGKVEAMEKTLTTVRPPLRPTSYAEAAQSQSQNTLVKQVHHVPHNLRPASSMPSLASNDSAPDADDGFVTQR